MADRTFPSGNSAQTIECSVVVRCENFHILTTLDFEVVPVQDIDEALELLQTDKDYDFILIDTDGPDMNGQAIISLKEVAPDVKIIVSTSNIDLIDGLMAAEADAFVIKPAPCVHIIAALIKLGLIG